MAWGMTMVGMAATTRYLKKMAPAVPDTWVIGPNTDYDVYIEFGTPRMPARPCVKTGAERAMVKINELASKAKDFNEFLRLLAFSVEKEIKDVIKEWDVIDTGNYWRSVTAEKQ